MRAGTSDPYDAVQRQLAISSARSTTMILELWQYGIALVDGK